MKSAPYQPLPPRRRRQAGSATLRRLLLASLVLASCAQVPVAEIGGYQWVADPNAPHCESVRWIQVSKERIPGLCMGRDGRRASEQTSCSIGCLVFSPYSEAEALQIKLGIDDNLLSHEFRHSLLGLVHPE